MGQSITGNDNANTLAGAEFGDTIQGLGGDDLLFGLGGHDLLQGGPGADTLEGGEGADTLGGGLAGGNLLLGGSGNDLVSYAGFAAGIAASLLEGGFAGDALGDLYGGVEDLLGTALADTLIGSAFANALAGGPSGDVLAGLGGEDLLDGGDGADSLSGGAGNDTMLGGTGADTMRGGVGDDLYRIELATDRAVEGLNSGADTVIATLDLTLAAHVEALVLEGPAAIGTGNAWNNRILGNALANVLTGAAGADTLIGGLGADTLRGGNGDDVLVGGPGNDRLEGGQGWDRIVSPFALDEVSLLKLASGAIRMSEATGLDVLFAIEELELAGTVWRPAPSVIPIGATTPWYVRTSRLDGPAASGIGHAVSGAGDVDGDGHADLLISAPGLNGSDGAAWLVWGRAGGFGANFAFADGSVRFVNGTVGQGGQVGQWVGALGDLDGDGFDEIGISAPLLPFLEAGTTQPVQGVVGVVGGRERSAFPLLGDGSVRFINNVADGTSNTILFGEAVTGQVGGVGVGAGDLNGDGLADIAVGGRAGAGYVSIVLGDASLPGKLGLGLTDGSVTRIATTLPGAESGPALGAGGDVNGDGFDDLIVGGAGLSGGAGGAWVLLGKAGGWGSTISLGSAGFLTVNPLAAGDAVGAAVAVVGDVNGDGVDDFALTATGALGGRGSLFLVFGRAGLAGPIALDAPTGVARLDGPDTPSGFGRRLSAAGDVNGDGYDDILVGGLNGRAWLVLGRPSFAAAPDVEAAGIIFLDGESNAFGRAIAPAGDLDGDGLDDLIIGAQSDADGAGAGWVIYGDRWLVI